MQKYEDRHSERKQPSEISAGSCPYIYDPIENPKNQTQEKTDAQKTELFRKGRKNKIVVSFGQKTKNRLRAFSESIAEPPAGTYCDF